MMKPMDDNEQKTIHNKLATNGQGQCYDDNRRHQPDHIMHLELAT